MTDRLFEPEEPKRSTQPKGPDALIGKSLDRKTIKALEVQQAVAVLAVFCEIADRRFEGQVWLKKIIMRLREHPEMALADHRDVIERNFAAPWWRGAATPSVIYGSADQFERSLAETGERRPANSTAERQSDLIRRLMA
jgi:hypothetical protein